MKIKKYVGRTAHEAMLKLKMELGSDAMIINTKKLHQKGIKGLFTKPLVEITAMYEDTATTNKNLINHYESKLSFINKEISDLKSKVKDISNIAKEEKEIERDKNQLHPALIEINKNLINNGVVEEISFNILKNIENNINLSNKDNGTIKKLVEFNISELLGESEPIVLKPGERKIIFLAGPTGVGKTTTLAKIAANLMMKEKYNIGLITSDTYRIAAVEQLRIYSEILQLPLKIAYNADEINQAINEFSDKDIILIDTAGRNHNDNNQIEELKNIISSIETKESFLLINASTDYRLLKTLVEKYNFLDNYKLIITKIDEANNYGNIVNIKYLTNKTLSYTTLGQNVPDDIQVIDIEQITKELIKEN